MKNIQLINLYFVKQKTAYEMRISDWSSDVCSSDLSLDGITMPSTTQHKSFNMPKDSQALSMKVRSEKIIPNRKARPMAGNRIINTGEAIREGLRDRKSVV